MAVKKDSYETMRKAKNWHHDIKMIDGKFVEDIVQKYQKDDADTDKDDLLDKIIENYAIFRPGWANGFAQYLDNDVEAGALMHDEIIWNSAKNFDRSKSKKPDGKAFNAYLVSALLNALKNFRNAKMSHKNHPRVGCPICHEEVYQIDAKHLRHKIDVERYKKMFPFHPVSSPDGKVICPITGNRVRRVDDAYLNRIMGYYTVKDFYEEYASVVGGTAKAQAVKYRCPISGAFVSPVAGYPASVAGCKDEDFIREYPDFDGLITCPINGGKRLHPTQESLDKEFHDGRRGRVMTMDVVANHQNATLEARLSLIYNPYTYRYVYEITPEDLRSYGTTVKEHISKYATIVLDKYYVDLVVCPFTGKKTHSITKASLKKMGVLVMEFYNAVCKYPLWRWRVKCAICGRWTCKIWEHLDDANHSYARDVTMEEFEHAYGPGKTKRHISTNAFVENDSGDSIYIADLLAQADVDTSSLDVEDSLLTVAQDEWDERLARAIRTSQTVEDVLCTAAERTTIKLPFSYQNGQTKAVRAIVESVLGHQDFDFLVMPKPGNTEVVIIAPSKDILRQKLLALIEASDLVE